MTLSKEPTTDERVPGNDYTFSSLAQMCASCPEKLKRRGLVSFTVSADTASRQNTQSLSVHPWLWWNWQLLLQTQRAGDRQECHTQYQCLDEYKVFCCGVKKTATHNFPKSTMPFSTQTLSSIPCVLSSLIRTKVPNMGLKWQPAWLDINVICVLGMASEYKWRLQSRS